MIFKKIPVILICLLTLILVVFPVSAYGINTGFSVEELTDVDKENFLANFEKNYITENPMNLNMGISCFDVNEKGLIAVLHEKSNFKAVCIYNSEGDFLYGYTFTAGQSIVVEWDGDNVNILLVRSDILISLDSSGKLQDIKEVPVTIENNEYKNRLRKNTRIVGDTKYIIRSNMGPLNMVATSYSQLVVIDGQGVEYVIFDVSSSQLTKTIIVVVVVFAFLCYATTYFVRLAVKNRKV